MLRHQQESASMSIGSVQSNPAVNPWATSAATQSGTGAPWDAAFIAVWSGSQNPAGVGGQATAPNPLQNIASDILAMLPPAQGTAAPATTPAVGASGSATSVTPEQQLVTDLQSLMNELQGTTSPNAQTASTNPADPTGQTQPRHHHHHHHESGGDASGATAIARSSTSSGSTTANNDQAVARTFTSDIMQALQAYGGNSGASVMVGVVV
jgi:hypothetical protein